MKRYVAGGVFLAHSEALLIHTATKDIDPAKKRRLGTHLLLWCGKLSPSSETNLWTTKGLQISLRVTFSLFVLLHDWDLLPSVLHISQIERCMVVANWHLDKPAFAYSLCTGCWPLHLVGFVNLDLEEAAAYF